MKTYFCYVNVRWDRFRSIITFNGAYLGSGPKKFEVSGTTKVVLKGEKLYLCKVKIKVGRHEDETFKLFVLDDDGVANFGQDNVQLVGMNIDGEFYFDKSFQEGMKKVTGVSSSVKIDRGQGESEKFIKDT